MSESDNTIEQELRDVMSSWMRCVSGPSGWIVTRDLMKRGADEIARLRKELEEAKFNQANWTKDAPINTGLYWHSWGDPEQYPVPLEIGYSGTSGKTFVMSGQYGIKRAIDCDKYGGFWMSVDMPDVPEEM